MGKNIGNLGLLRRLLRPTLSDCLVTWLLLGLCFGVPIVHRISNNDTWWHLRTGQMILQTHSVPRVDPFSFTMLGKQWVAHEWLSEVILWLTFSRFGFGGLSLLRSLAILAIFCIVFITARSRTSSVKPALLATGLAAIISMDAWSERPHIFGYLLLAVLMWLIARYRRGGSLWLLPPLFAVWINLHGSWLIGLVILLWVGVESGWTAGAEGKRSRFTHIVMVMALVLIALLFNPRPLVYLTYPFQYMGENHHTSYLSEWQSPDFHQARLLIFAAVLLGLTPLLRWTRARLNWFECSLVLGLAGLSLFSARHLPVFAIVSAPFIAEHLSSLQWSEFSDSQGQSREPILLNWMLILMLLALILIRLPRQGPTPYLDLSKYPVNSFNRLGRFQGGRLLTNLDWGSFAIYRLWPKYHVFIDGRADVYGPKLIESVRVLDVLGPGWRDELNRLKPAAVVWPSREPLAQALALSPDWARVEVKPPDPVASVFVPKSSLAGPRQPVMDGKR